MKLGGGAVVAAEETIKYLVDKLVQATRLIKPKLMMAFGGEKENDLTNEQPAEGGATGQVE